MPATATRIHRFEVRSRPEIGDPLAQRILRDSAWLHIRPEAIATTRLYLVSADLSERHLDTLRSRLLADPVLQTASLGVTPTPPAHRTIEVHPLPGVMDPAAQTLTRAVSELTGLPPETIEVTTGWRYDLAGITEQQARTLATGLLANTAIEQIHHEPWLPDAFPHAHPADQTLRHITITTLDDAQLESLSREAHLFLSLDEMRAIRDEYKLRKREPTDIELETLAQTWSEHCVHKTLKSTVRYTPHEHDIIDWHTRPGVTINPDNTITISNLLKSTIAAATHELIDDGIDWTLSVFVDNAGIIRFTDDTAVCIKVETHNHPSAIEPYGGAATGIGGCIRDIIGTGLAAKPIANTDVFCVAHPDTRDIPKGCLHPRRTLTRIVEGVRDYANRMGIPTVNGAVYFDDRYIGNPLVFCGSIGVMPADRIEGHAQPGDRIIALGGRTGRDGIHGATFSSAELTDTHADEFSHAVQIGNAIEEKRVLDAILRARDAHPAPLFRAITDCGAGGFSSAIGEMGEAVGAIVDLEKAPLKYAGLRYDEIWISESQERMLLAVPPANIGALQTICDEEGVELADLGIFGNTGADGAPELRLHFEGNEVGRLSMPFLHDAIPMPVREARWSPPSIHTRTDPSHPSIVEQLLDTLAHPNVASKRWIIRQYDHEVQGATIVKPLVGPSAIGPSDAGVIQPVPHSRQGLAIGCGLGVCTPDSPDRADPYLMALRAVDECIRNLVCTGADPRRIAILDNFCWPSCNRPENMGALVRACIGCYDAAKAFRTPFVSGKDSLNNQFRTEDGRLIEIPYTLLITGIGIVPDINNCITTDAKQPGNLLVCINADLPAHDPSWLLHAVQASRLVNDWITRGLIRSAHDISDGGALCAIAEMLIGAPSLGAHIDLTALTENLPGPFAEPPAGYILEVAPDALADMLEALTDGVSVRCIGKLTDDATLTLSRPAESVPVADLAAAFLSPLNWA